MQKNDLMRKDDRIIRVLEIKDDTVLIIDCLRKSMLEDVEIAEVIKKIRAIGYQLCDSLDLDDSFSPNPIEFDFGENVVIGNEDIPRMLAMLRSKKEDLYNLFVETIYDLFPEFNNIDLQVLAVKDSDSLKKQAIMLTTSEDGKSEKSAEIPYHIRDELYRLVIESRYLNQPISMEHMSTGTKRIFWLVANAVVSEFKQINLLGVDEIETSIDFWKLDMDIAFFLRLVIYNNDVISMRNLNHLDRCILYSLHATAFIKTSPKKMADEIT